MKLANPSPARMFVVIGLAVILCGSAACAAPSHTSRAPTPPIAPKPADWFEDVTAPSGIGFVPQFCHTRIANILLSNGSGAAVFDYDTDGWPDIYLLNAGPLDRVTAPGHCAERLPSRLYRNKRGAFEDRTAPAGLAGNGFETAAATGDFDNDGFIDLYVTAIGRNVLYRNRGDGTFADVTDRAGVGDRRCGISAVFFDADRDGWLDLFVANYLTYIPEQESEQNPGAYPGPLAYTGQANVYYRNLGDGTFGDLTRTAGLFSTNNRAMSVSAFDCDRDGDTDLYISNDDTPNNLFLNDGQGHFRDAAVEAGVAFNSIGEAPGSMNASVGDVNGDGLPDLFVTRLGYGSLYQRDLAGFYNDRMWASQLGRLTQRFVGWGGVFFDFDNDADLDLSIANGDAFRLEGTTLLLLENDGAGNFTDASAQGGAVFATPINGRGNCVLDFDNDGRLDLLITALADRPFLLRNRASKDHHWLKLRLEGSRSNRSGYGARVVLETGNLKLVADSLCPSGFLSQGDTRLHFGLGARRSADRISIQWPSGLSQTLTNIAAGQILFVREPPL